jgi:hypothetical protein
MCEQMMAVATSHHYVPSYEKMLKLLCRLFQAF